MSVIFYTLDMSTFMIRGCHIISMNCLILTFEIILWPQMKLVFQTWLPMHTTQGRENDVNDYNQGHGTPIANELG